MVTFKKMLKLFCEIFHIRNDSLFEIRVSALYFQI